MFTLWEGKAGVVFVPWWHCPCLHSTNCPKTAFSSCHDDGGPSPLLCQQWLALIFSISKWRDARKYLPSEMPSHRDVKTKIVLNILCSFKSTLQTDAHYDVQYSTGVHCRSNSLFCFKYTVTWHKNITGNTGALSAFHLKWAMVYQKTNILYMQQLKLCLKQAQTSSHRVEAAFSFVCVQFISDYAYCMYTAHMFTCWSLLTCACLMLRSKTFWNMTDFGVQIIYFCLWPNAYHYIFSESTHPSVSLHPFTLLITALLSSFLFLPLSVSIPLLLYVQPHDLSQQSLLPLSGTHLLSRWCISCCGICYRKWIMLVKQSWVIMFQMMLYRLTLSLLFYLLLRCSVCVLFLSCWPAGSHKSRFPGNKHTLLDEHTHTLIHTHIPRFLHAPLRSQVLLLLPNCVVIGSLLFHFTSQNPDQVILDSDTHNGNCFDLEQIYYKVLLSLPWTWVYLK